MNQNTPQSDPCDVLTQDNVSDVLSIEENIKLEKIFDEYFLYRTTEYVSDDSYDMIVDEFLQMIHEGFLPVSPLGIERTDLQDIMTDLKSIFAEEKNALLNLQITITNNDTPNTYYSPITIHAKSIEAKKFDTTSAIVAQFSQYYNYQALDTLLDTTIIDTYVTKDTELLEQYMLIQTGIEQGKSIEAIYQELTTQSIQIDRDALTAIGSITDIKRKQHTLICLLFNNNSEQLSASIFNELIAIQSSRENRETTINILATFYPNLFINSIEKFGLEQDSLELKNDILFTMLQSGNIRSFQSLLQYPQLQFQDNYDTVIDFIEKDPKNLFITRSAKSTGSPLKMKFIARHLSDENLYKTVRILTSRFPHMILQMDAKTSICKFPETKRRELCEIILLKNPYTFKYLDKEFYEVFSLDQESIAHIEAMTSKNIKKYQEAIDQKINFITKRYGVKEITYKESSLLLGYDPVDDTYGWALEDFLVNLEAQLYKYPPFVLQGKTIKIANTAGSHRGFSGIAPDQNTMILDINSPDIFDHELFHTKDREDGRRKDNKQYKKNLSRKNIKRNHFSLAGRTNESQATEGEKLFSDTFCNKETVFLFRILEQNTLPQGEKKQGTFQLPKKYQQKIREKMKKITDLDQLHKYGLISYKLKTELMHTTPEEAKKQVHKEETITMAIEHYKDIYQQLRTTELLTGCAIGYEENQGISFKKEISDWTHYGYDQEKYEAGPDHRAKRFGDKVTPEMRVKYFNSMIDQTFNGRKKSQDGTWEIIEADFS